MKEIILTLTLFIAMCKVNAQLAGQLDITFNNGSGYREFSANTGLDQAKGVLIQPDGKIVVCGTTISTVTGKDFVLIRLLSNGLLDSTFGVNGAVSTDLQGGSDDEANDLALQTDGKIVLAGNTDNGIAKDAVVLRYSTNGSIDSTFGTNGRVIFDIDSNGSDILNVIKFHPITGNLIVGGYSQINTTKSKPAVARFNSSGAFDTTFSNVGKRTLWVTSLDYQYFFSLEDLEVLPNGKICGAGWREFIGSLADRDLWFCKINSNGTMDNTFSNDGVAVKNGSFNGNDQVMALALNSSSDFIYAGSSYVSNLYPDILLGSVTATGNNGTILNTMNNTGFGVDNAYSIAANSSGEYILGGRIGTNQNRSFHISKHDASTGSLVTTFGTNGKTATTFNGNALNECFDIAIQADDKIVAVGYSGTNIIVARYLNAMQPTLNNFQLSLPVNNSTTVPFPVNNFYWTAAFGATGYDLEIDTNNQFTAPVVNISTNVASQQVTNLAANTTYFWRVRAKAGTSIGNWSTVWKFTTVPINSPVLNTPANNATNVNAASINLDWLDVNTAATYECQVSLVNSFATLFGTQTVTPSDATFTGLNYNKAYFWRVRSNDGTNLSPWSTTWKFTTSAAPASVSSDQKEEIEIHPIPATNKLLVQLKNQGTFSNVKIISLQGQLLLKNSFDHVTNATVDISQLANGNYILSIDDKLIKKIIKE